MPYASSFRRIRIAHSSRCEPDSGARSFGSLKSSIGLPSMLRRLLQPFQTAEAKRLAVLFSIVYFAQGMFYLPDQVISIVFKDRGLKSDQVAYFFLLTAIPWFIKPVYGLISDFVPLFGRRRKSWLLLSSALGCCMALL